IPAIAPVVSPRPLRPTVNEKLHGIFLAWIKVWRLDEKPFDPVALRAREPEGFKGGHGNLGEDGVVEVSKVACLCCRTLRRRFVGLSEEHSPDFFKAKYARPRLCDKELCWYLGGYSAEDNRAQRKVSRYRPGLNGKSDVVIVAIDDLDRLAALETHFRHDPVNGGLARILSSEGNLMSSDPGERPKPAVKVFSQINALLPLTVVQHQTPAVALVSRTLLRAIGDVLPIRRIERSLIRRLVVGSDVLGLDGRDARPSIDWDDEQIIVGADGFNFIVVRGEANLLAIGGKGVIVLPAKMKRRRIVIAGSKVAGFTSRNHVGTAALGCPVERSSTIAVRCRRLLPGVAVLDSRGGCPGASIDGDHKQMTALPLLVRIPMPVK